MKCFVLVCLLLPASAFTYAATINVPADQPTIQAAINAAKNGDTVLVAPGTYFENINFEGKAITVKSSGGNKVTIIDGGHANSVVTFNTGEGRKSVIHGFTIQNGDSGLDGGGILASSASPTISGNTVTNNLACNAGAGIAVEFSSALVQNNVISSNKQSGCSGGTGGAGINIGGAGSAQIIGNTIQNNTWGSGDGGGIALFAAGTPTLKNNIIRGNVATGVIPAAQGGGIYIVNDSNAIIVQNLIYNNTAGQGSGIYFLVPSGSVGPVLVNNTIVGTSSSSEGSAVYADGFDDQVQFFNNLMIGPSGANAVFCDSTYDQTPPTFTSNDAFSANGNGLQGTCSAQSSTNGNISADPLFAGKTNFHLKAGSPAINAGDNSAPDLPPLDLSNKPRIVGGIIDIGAYEFQ
ncbi:MAG TPA: right-handed parallel beta-helix repeat-containing protein [Candidatus Sulfotelmatobacter sp.]|nr:right-handed parallel beta-helix repeat-containing protein [Candidatus Sulfotelmatobacter sp.]